MQQDTEVANIRIVATEGIEWEYRAEYRLDGADPALPAKFYGTGPTIVIALAKIIEAMQSSAAQVFTRSPLFRGEDDG